MKNLNYHKPTSLNLTNERKQNLKGNFINTLLFAGKKFHFAIIIFFAILANILTPIKVLAYLTNIPVGTTQTVTTNWSPGTAIVVYGVLIINPGVTIEMPPNSFITVEENGRLVAIGTSGSPITFTNVPTYNHWAGMQILGNPAIPLQPSYSDAYSGHVTIYGGSYTHDYKGAAFLKYCNIQNCNYGTICGSINYRAPYNYLSVFGPSSNGGGALYAEDNTYTSIDYVAIAFAPFSTPNLSQIQGNTINWYNKNTMAIAIALYQVAGQMLINSNIISCKAISTSINVLNMNYQNIGVYALSSGYLLNSNTFSGWQNAVVDDNSTGSSYSRAITSNTFTNNFIDIWGGNGIHLTIFNNTSTKNNNSTTVLTPNTETGFAQIVGGDDYNLIQNTASVSHLGSYQPGGILYGPSTNTGKLTQNNTLTNFLFSIDNDGANFGMQIECNTFNNTQFDVFVQSPGGLASPQGSHAVGQFNTWHAGCTGSSQWFQNPGAKGVNYYWKTSGEPVCNNITLSGAILSPSCSSTLWIKSPNPAKTDLSNTMSSLTALPAYPYLITLSTQLDDYKRLNMQRDFDLSQLIQYYIDTAMYDSAFYTISAYPCQKSNLEKMELLLTLDSNYSSFSSLETAISNGFSLCSSGSGHCDNIYYDSILSAEATTFYPMLIDLNKHSFSDSVISAYSSILSSYASDTVSYFGSCVRNILQTQSDSFFREYIPHDSTYIRTVLYPINWGIPDTSDAAPEIASISGNNTSNGEWKIYPNPASTTLYISLPNTAPDGNRSTQYKIYSTLCKEVLDGIIKADAASIDISSLAKGAYILELSNGKSFSNFNFIHQ